jgi:hypothetical protein
MKGFVLRLDEVPSKNKYYNFRYYTNSEGSSINPIPLENLDAVIDLLLCEIQERDAILDKLKTTREVSIGVNTSL